MFHHHAKALRNLSRYREAIEICEKILTRRQVPATRLLLARLLMFENSGRERAQGLLFALLREAKAAPEKTEITVTLAAITAIGQWQLKTWFREALTEFGEVVARYILNAAARGFDQAFVAFATISRALQYNDEALFQKVFDQLPNRSVDEIQNDKERAALGDIFLTAAKGAEGDSRNGLLQHALQFYQSLSRPNTFNEQQLGQTLVHLRQFDYAVSVLQPLVEKSQTPWNRYWLSKAFLGLGQLSNASTMIDAALNDPRAKEYRAAFLEHRFDVRLTLKDPSAIEDLKAAISACDDPKHKAALVLRANELLPESDS